MKAKLTTTLLIVSLLYAIVILTSCSQNEDFVPNTSKKAHAIKALLNVTKNGFDSQETTRSGSSRTNWLDGEIIYLLFTTNYGTTIGTAVYDASSSTWTVSHSGNLTNAVNAKVKAYYFEQPISTTLNNATLAATTAVYRADDGIYNCSSGGDLDIALTLRPITSRIRFKGTPGTRMSIDEGITTYSSYTVLTTSTTSLIKNKATIHLTFGSDGYTPYIYGVFEDTWMLGLKVSNGKYQFVKKKSYASNEVRIGDSGWMNIPTESTHDGWTMTDRSNRTFTVNGNGRTVSFDMKLVEGGTFLLEHGTDHEVTLTKDYYIGETEVTQDLWYAVMGLSPTTSHSWDSYTGLGTNYPAYYVSYYDCLEFITKLNQMTGQNFRLPTEAEWAFASYGGIYSKGYRFPGGDNPLYLGWYKDNSDGKSHPVKGKTANELGLFDMLGNVDEWCSDWYDNNIHSDSPQIDPTGPSTGTEKMLGGSDFNTGYASLIRSLHYSSWKPDYPVHFTGFRLAL